jgi:hypothetical protein
VRNFGRSHASCKVAAARRLIVAFDSGTQPITTDTTLTQARAFTQIRPDTGWPCSDRIEPRPHRREECERQRGTNPETFGKPARGRQWLGTSPATDRALGKKPDASRRTARRGSRAAKCAEQAVAETKKLQGVTTRPQRHLDLTTRSGAEGRYVFVSAPDGQSMRSSGRQSQPISASRRTPTCCAMPAATS